MQLQYWRDGNAEAVARRLWGVAEASEVRRPFREVRGGEEAGRGTDGVVRAQELSGRSLRRLPALALAMYTTSDPCPIEEAVAALARAVEDERDSRVGEGAGRGA